MEGERRDQRRGLSLHCEVMAELWDEPVLLRSRDLSPRGVWLETELPLEPGDPIWVALSLPDGTHFSAEGTVCRSEFRGEAAATPSGMAIEFRDPQASSLVRIARAMVGHPPPLPQKNDPFRRQERLQPMRMTVTYQEVFGDQVNSYEVEEQVSLVVDDEPEFVAEGTLLKSGPKRPRRLHALSA